MGYLSGSFLCEIPIQRSLMVWGLQMKVAKGHAKQSKHQRTLAVKQLCSQCGQSPHSVCCASLLQDFHGNWAGISPTSRSISPIKITWCHTHCLSWTHPVFQSFVTCQCIEILFSTSSLGYALLNASWTAENNFKAM